jgi:hypothetical protein
MEIISPTLLFPFQPSQQHPHFESYDPLDQQDHGAQQESAKGSSFRPIKVRGLQQEETFVAYASPKHGIAYGALKTENDWELRTQSVVSTN